MTDENRTSVAQLAVFADEKAPAETDVPIGQHPGCAVLAQSRIPLGACGTPYDVYELADFEAALAMKTPDGSPRYRAAVFLIHTPTPAMESAIAAWQAAQRPLLRITADAPLTAEAAHALCTGAGVHTYAAAGDVVYACRNWLCIHAAEAGEKQLHLPVRYRVTPVLTDETAGTDTFETQHFTVTLKQYETRLFRLETL